MIEKVKTESLNGTRIDCNRTVLQFMVDNMFKFEKGLSAYLFDELTAKYGKHTDTLKGEFIHKIWTLKFKDLIFNVFTAKQKGTSIEMVGKDYDDVAYGRYNTDVIEFLTELQKEILT